MAESKFINPLFQRTEGAPPQPSRALRESQDSASGNAAGLRQAQATAAGQATIPTGEAPAPHAEAGSQAPVKFTFYFMPDQLERLDNVWVKAKVDHRDRLNKSEFVRLALDRLMEEFDRDPTGVIADVRRQRAG